MRITRRHLQVSLGSLWLLDGVLQCQPIMFSKVFARHILAPAGSGQPITIAAPLRLVRDLISAQPALFNAIVVVIQLTLGIALVTRRFNRAALAGSIVWALSVWVVGEGVGGLTTGATLLTGAPGAAVLYAVIAALAWPTREDLGDERPSRLALPAWCALWLTGAGLELIHGNNSSGAISMALRDARSSAPRWIAGIDGHLGALRIPSWTAGGLSAVFVLVAIWALVPGVTRQLSVGIGTLLSLTAWFLFQGLGDVTSGRSTDPNAGPLIVLLALAVIGAHSPGTEQQPVDGVAISESTAVTSLATTSSSKTPFIGQLTNGKPAFDWHEDGDGALLTARSPEGCLSSNSVAR